MDTQIYLSNLYDYYKKLLTDKQQAYFEDYYFDNLTMEEIAENYNVSKNAISKSLIEVKEKLEYYEDSLHLLSNKEKIENVLTKEEIEKIIDYI